MWGDVMRLNRFKTALQLAAVALCLVIYFCSTQTIISAVKEGLLLCFEVVIPSLYIFIVICNILSGLKCTQMIAVPFMPFFRLLKISSRQAAGYCILGILGGFATGGIMLDKIKKEYSCDKNTLSILSILMSGNSPSFVILAVGRYYLDNIKLGLVLYFSTLLSAFVTAFFISFIFNCGINNTSKNILVSTNNIIFAIKDSVAAITNICGVVVLIFALCKVVNLYTDNLFISLAFSAILEVTTACDFIFKNFNGNIYLLSLTLSLLPLSAYLQIKSYGNNNTLNFKILFLSKIIQLPVSVVILRTFLNLFPFALNVYSSGDISINTYWNAPHISCWLFIVSVCFVILFDKKLKDFTIKNK